MIQSPIYFSVSVDIYRPAPQPIVNAQQGDSGRGLSITLWADGNLLNPTTEVITLYAQKPDGTVSYLPCTVSDGNILCAFTNQMLAIPGDVRIQLQVALTDTMITSTVCIVNVLESIIDKGAIESTNEFTALERLLTEIEELKKNGLKGEPGEAATIKVGKVEASPSGSSPSVTNSGTPQNAVFDFVLPRGAQGEQGEPGKQDLFFGARSTFPQTGDASILYIDNTVTPAVQYIWKDSEYILAGGGGGDVTAESVSYDNASSGLTANTVQGAIDENAEGIKSLNSKIGFSDIEFGSVELGVISEITPIKKSVKFKNAHKNIPQSISLTYSAYSYFYTEMHIEYGSMTSTGFDITCIPKEIGSGTGAQKVYWIAIWE